MFFFKPLQEESYPDLQAAVNASLLAIPQGMAYALVAGLPLHYGLLGSAIAALLGGLAGKTHFITLGPTNATSVLLFAVFANLGLIQQSGLISETGLDLLPWIILFAGAFFSRGIPIANFLHDSIHIPDRYHRLRNGRCLSHHCQSTQTYSWLKFYRRFNPFIIHRIARFPMEFPWQPILTSPFSKHSHRVGFFLFFNQRSKPFPTLLSL